MPRKKSSAELDREIEAALATGSDGHIHRGWRITPLVGAVQMGYRLPNSRSLRAQLGFGNHRKMNGYEVHNPEGGTKIVSTLKAARAYIDDYLGSE